MRRISVVGDPAAFFLPNCLSIINRLDLSEQNVSVVSVDVRLVGSQPFSDALSRLNSLQRGLGLEPAAHGSTHYCREADHDVERV